MTTSSEKRDKAEKLSKLARAYCLADLYVFGSRAAEIAAMIIKGEALPPAISSDVDIGIRPQEGVRPSLQDLVNLSIELEDLFGVNRIDLVLLPEADPFLALDVIRGELLYTNDPLDQARYELFVLRRAGDLLPWKRERIDMILRGQVR